MPLCTLHLLALQDTVHNAHSTFLSTVQKADPAPLVISRVIRWIILPTKLSTDPLLARNIHWDFLLILPSTDPLPESLKKLVQHHWHVAAGIPSRLLSDFHGKNQKLLHPDPSSVPQLTGSLDAPKIADSAQDLELSPELQQWVKDFSSKCGARGHGAVSMLNLLSFKPGMKSQYLKYGAAFAGSIGSKRGGDAKLVGTVVNVNGQQKSKKEEENQGEALWDEIALAHYPTIMHFADMLGSEDYQKVNKEFRVPSLRDTFILCTSEIGLHEGEAENVVAKL